MRFSCPECGASYKIENEHRLAKSGGRVECYRCQHVFEVQGIAPPTAAKKRQQPKLKKKTAPAKRIKKAPQRNTQGPITGVITGAQPTYDIPGSAERLDAPPVVPDRPKPTPSKPQVPAKPASAPVEKQPKAGGLLWGIGALLLAVGLALNALWHLRGDPRAHATLVDLCAGIGCEVPPLRNAGAMRITERVFTRIPDHPDILIMRLRLANTAGFPQPYPGIELVLYDSSQTIIGRGRLVAEDYLGGGTVNNLGPGEVGEIELSMLDAGQDATGFEVAFF